MALNLANVISTDTFQTWLTRTNQIIERASNTTPDALTFIGNTAVVPHSEGKLFYDNSVDTLRYFASANTSIAIGHEVNIYVKNNTGSVIPKGSAVYSDGEDNAIPTIQLSKADAQATHDVLGLTKEEINVGDTGHVTTTGIVFTDTSSFSVGNLLYVSPTTAGTLTATEPTFPNFPVRVGKVLLSSATQGCILVNIVDETFGEMRSTENARVDGNLTVGGNFTVLGTETITTLTNLSVDDSFVYLNGGDTITANSTAVTGLNDLTFKGHYNGGNTVTYYLKIDNTSPGNPDTFSWSLDNFSTTEAANVAITGLQQSLRWGISALFVANTGHTAGDVWTGAAAPLNIDTGWASNRNTGQAAGGYTHMGVFFDVTDERFKFFQSYDPEVEGNINTAHASFELGTVQANTFIGDGSQLTNAGSTVATDSANHDLFVPFTGVSSGTMTSANVNSNFTFNPSTGTLSATAFSGDGSNLTNAGSTVATDTVANRELTVAFTGVSSGTMTSANVNPNFTFNPATGALSANAFIGDGSQLTNAGSSVATDSANHDLFVPFTGISSGTMTSANVNAAFTFNPSTGTLTATAFSGDGSQLTNAGSTVATDTTAARDLFVTFTGVSSGTMTSANVNSTFTFNPGTGTVTANTMKTSALKDSSDRTLTIRDEANTIVWGG